MTSLDKFERKILARGVRLFIWRHHLSVVDVSLSLNISKSTLYRILKADIAQRRIANDIWDKITLRTIEITEEVAPIDLSLSCKRLAVAWESST